MEFVFFGTPQISVDVLEILKAEGLLPSLVVTAPDKPKGRGMKMSSPPVKIWAQENRVKFLQPQKFDAEFIHKLQTADYELFIVVAYGKILPKEVLRISKHGAINLHYSLLPKLRGASPVETAILKDINPTGASTILMNEKMDEGPILLQQEVYFESWPLSKNRVFQKLNEVGGKLLAETIKLWPNEKIIPKEQNHQDATYTQKITKKDGLIDLNDNQELNYRKFLAFNPWPSIYFLKGDKRIKITDAEFRGGKFIIKRVIPEGKREIDYSALKI